MAQLGKISDEEKLNYQKRLLNYIAGKEVFPVPPETITATTTEPTTTTETTTTEEQTTIAETTTPSTQDDLLAQIKGMYFSSL